ncbi:hypothetical protein ACRB68_58290 [Actinomadura sp. RB68]|uniref:Uncharacterized protein n=1 Tax=Actinomadura macrotermitis TaxID=2585200 RepID=A0A7K0C2L8_9ACTN|nr:hypothetical protein [Actinomadura macrotermitis]
MIVVPASTPASPAESRSPMRRLRAHSALAACAIPGGGA